VTEQSENGGRILEDGFAMQLTREAWQSVRRALCDGEELSIAATAGMPFALTWRDATPARPAERVERVAPVAADAAARAASSDAAAPDAARAGGMLALGSVRLLTPEAEFAARASADDLAAFCREIHRCAERVLAGHDGALALRLQVICRPRSHRVGMSHKGDATEQLLDRLIDALEQLAPLPVRGEVSFELELTLAAGPRDFPG